MRQIKFRAWDLEEKGWLRDFSIHETGFLLHIVNQRNPEPGEIAVMQFTGILDSKGKEIFEGDILSSKDWDDKYEVVKWDSDHGKHAVGMVYGYIMPEKPWEIIGNIYENPELIPKP